MSENRRLGLNLTLRVQKISVGFQIWFSSVRKSASRLKTGLQSVKILLEVHKKAFKRLNLTKSSFGVCRIRADFFLEIVKTQKPVAYRQQLPHPTPLLPMFFFTSSTTKLTEAYKYRNECVNLIFCPLTVRHRYQNFKYL